MKISDAQSTRASQIVGVNPPQVTTDVSGPAAGSNTNNGSSPAAKVELSQEAQTIGLARQAVAAVPETRDDLVSRIKAQVDSGTYQVSATDIADQMVRRARADSLR